MTKRSTIRSIENGAISALPIFHENQACFRASNLGNRGRDRTRQFRSRRDRHLTIGLAGRDCVDQIGIDEAR